MTLKLRLLHSRVKKGQGQRMQQIKTHKTFLPDAVMLSD